MKRKGVDHKQAGVKTREQQKTEAARQTPAEVKRRAAGLHKRPEVVRQMREEVRQRQVALPFVEDHWEVLQRLAEERRMREEEKMMEEVRQMREVPPFSVVH